MCNGKMTACGSTVPPSEPAESAGDDAEVATMDTSFRSANISRRQRCPGGNNLRVQLKWQSQRRESHDLVSDSHYESDGFRV